MKNFFIIFVISLSFLTFIPPAFAHVLATDKSIGAILHIDPDDDPIAGLPTSFFLEFKDKENKFASTNCYCRIDILQHGKVIYSNALFQDSINKNTDSASDSFTFPQKDVYQVVVTGKPRSGNIFQLFRLTYDIRVARETNEKTAAQNNNATNNWISTYFIYIIIGFITLVGIFATIKWRLDLKKGEKNEKISHNDRNTPQRDVS